MIVPRGTDAASVRRAVVDTLSRRFPDATSTSGSLGHGMIDANAPCAAAHLNPTL